MAFFPTAETIDFGGHIFTDIQSTDFWLAVAGTANGFSTFRTVTGSGGGSAYQIPDATDLRIIGVRFSPSSTTGSGLIGYSDNSVDNVTVGSVTNPVYMTGGNTVNLNYVFFNDINSSVTSFYTNWVIDAGTTPGKYPFAVADITSWRMWAYCREE